jgi:hypothetical protein
MNSISKYLLRLAYTLAKLIVPRNSRGDQFIGFINFVIRHKRLPTNKLIFNDVLYQIKTTSEIYNPLRSFISDKEFVKVYVKAIVGDQYNVPTIDVIRSEDEVDSYIFPENCCIKPTQASGRVILRKNASSLDKAEIRSWFHINHYNAGREANYKHLLPKIIIEPLIFNNSNVEDYKFFCYQGKPKLIQVDIDRYIHHTRKFFDLNWKELDFSIIYPKSNKPLLKPKNLDEMLFVAGELSKAFTMIRVDLYSDGKIIFVGELTNVSENAEGKFIPKSAELEVSGTFFG